MFRSFLKLGGKGGLADGKAKKGTFQKKLKIMSGQLQLEGIRRIKKHNILALIILALVVRLFFSIFLGDNALAKKSENTSGKQCFSSIDPLKNINPENEFGEKKAKKWGGDLSPPHSCTTSVLAMIRPVQWRALHHRQWNRHSHAVAEYLLLAAADHDPP